MSMIGNYAEHLPVGVAVGVARVVGIGGQLGAAQEALAEECPLALVLDGHHHDPAVAGLERAVRVDRGVRGAGPRRGRRTLVRVVQREAHPLHRGFQHGHVDHGAAPGAAPLQQRGQHSRVGVHAGGDVGHRDADLGRLPRRTGDRDPAPPRSAPSGRRPSSPRTARPGRTRRCHTRSAADGWHAARPRPDPSAPPRPGPGSARTRPLRSPDEQSSPRQPQVARASGRLASAELDTSPLLILCNRTPVDLGGARARGGRPPAPCTARAGSTPGPRLRSPRSSTPPRRRWVRVTPAAAVAYLFGR